MMPAVWKMKGLLVRVTCPIFFRKIGAGTQFTGRIRWPIPFRNVTIGRNCRIGHDAYFQTGRHSEIRVGDNTSINSACHIVASQRITIGRNVAIAEGVSIRDQEHGFKPSTGVRGQGFRYEPVEIGDNVWIGKGVYVGMGTSIGSGSIVAANSFVKGRFPPNVLIAGTPATVRRHIGPDGSFHRPTEHDAETAGTSAV